MLRLQWYVHEVDLLGCSSPVVNLQGFTKPILSQACGTALFKRSYAMKLMSGCFITTNLAILISTHSNLASFRWSFREVIFYYARLASFHYYTIFS